MYQVSFSYTVVWLSSRMAHSYSYCLLLPLLSSFMSCVVGILSGSLLIHQEILYGDCKKTRLLCALEISCSINYWLASNNIYTHMNATLCRWYTEVHCNHFSVVCHHFENEWLKIAATILDLATVSEGEDVLQLAKRFLTVTIEPPWIIVSTHTHLCANTTHTQAHTLSSPRVGRPPHRGGQGMQARE